MSKASFLYILHWDYLRQNLESRLDAEVDAILDELLGVPAVPEPEGIAGDGSASDGG
ncbi:DUF826 domain-containing protein, partial [Escherichia coli]|uniref:DUF826 domain-containing protein n=1 Tax=Escherichia coli TaxID=562 RepID=UPI003EE3413E